MQSEQLIASCKKHHSQGRFSKLWPISNTYIQFQLSQVKSFFFRVYYHHKMQSFFSQLTLSYTGGGGGGDGAKVVALS